MSRESTEWLNNNVLIGYTDSREHWATQGLVNYRNGGEDLTPWFALPGYDGGYHGPVPIEAVESRLFHWEALTSPLISQIPSDLSSADTIDADGNGVKYLEIPDRIAVIRSDTEEVLGVFKDSYRVHPYQQWLVENISTILDDEVCIDSAGLLKGGAVAWVSVSLPDDVVTEGGLALRPRILAFTSMNGQFATTYMRSVNAPVCDNSLTAEIAGADADQVFKIKHSSNSVGRITDAREALQILYQQAEEVTEFYDSLTRQDVTDAQFKQIINMLDPVPDPVLVEGKVKNQRAITMAEDRRLEVATMYTRDHRAAPWYGTALGVLMAFNTWDQQGRKVRGTRQERQMLGTLAGGVDGYDKQVLGAIESVLTPA